MNLEYQEPRRISWVYLEYRVSWNNELYPKPTLNLTLIFNLAQLLEGSWYSKQVQKLTKARFEPGLGMTRLRHVGITIF